MRPWPSKCCQSGPEFASYDLLTLAATTVGETQSDVDNSLPHKELQNSVTWRLEVQFINIQI